MSAEEQAILSRTRASFSGYQDDSRKALIMPTESEQTALSTYEAKYCGLKMEYLENLRIGIDQNALVCARIASALDDDNINTGLFMVKNLDYSSPPTSQDFSKVRSVIRQFAREWSSDGASERSVAFGHICDGLIRLYPDPAIRGKIKILVPGCGLGRLPYELSLLGFDTVGNEFSSHMALASLMLLNSGLAQNELTICPYIHSHSHWRLRHDFMRSVKIPDVSFEASQPGNMSMGVGDFFELAFSKETVEKFPVLVTCYFIDAPSNFFETLEAITRLVDIGGYWVNFGPLHWHNATSADESSNKGAFLDLALEDVINAIQGKGWSLLEQKSAIPTTYCSTHPNRMGRMLFDCEFWIAKRIIS